MDTVKRLMPYLHKQIKLDLTSVRPIHKLTVTEDNYEEVVQTTTDMLSRVADSYFTAVDLAITVNSTAAALFFLNSTIDRFLSMNFSVSPVFDYYTKHCLGVASEDCLSQQVLGRCLEIKGKMTRHLLVYQQFQLCQTRFRCDAAKALMKSTSVCNHFIDVTKLISGLVDTELDLTRMHVCGLKETDSAECQMVRSQVRLLWQLQYELADGLASYFDNRGMLEQAKEYTKIALEKLPKSSVEKKWKVMVELKLNLAKIELSLGNYWDAVYILRNCSLTIDEQK